MLDAKEQPSKKNQEHENVDEFPAFISRLMEEALDEFLKQNIINKLLAALEKAGVEPEPELVERLNASKLQDVAAVAAAFPGYIAATILAKGMEGGGKNVL